MNIKRLNEKLRKVLSENQMSESKRQDIDFNNVGCGFYVDVTTTKDDYFALYCNGYSNNTEKQLEFVSKIKDDNSEDSYNKVIELRTKLETDLKNASNEFDKTIVEIMKKHGLKKV